MLGIDSQGTIARPSICSDAKMGEEGTVSGGMRGEEQDEGDVGGETEGWRGLHGEPLCGRPRGRGMKHVSCWLGGIGYRGWRQEACSQNQVTLSLQVPKNSDGGFPEENQVKLA